MPDLTGPCSVCSLAPGSRLAVFGTVAAEAFGGTLVVEDKVFAVEGPAVLVVAVPEGKGFGGGDGKGMRSISR